jgi:prepilin-type N-terminal cleavage/methylation domain-containing protein
MMRASNTTRPGVPRRAGFTLIELLAVILIVAILSGVLITQLGGADDSAKASRTAGFLQELEAILGDYEREFGAYPPSRFTPEQGVANDGENVGVEALVVALFSNRWEAGGHNIEESYFANVDEDLSSRSLTDFGNRKLLELVDAWKNPIAYLARTDYGSEDRFYTTVREDGQVMRTAVLALKDPVQGRYYKHTSFQLISAGVDGEFNTPDDIHNFERPRK